MKKHLRWLLLGGASLGLFGAGFGMGRHTGAVEPSRMNKDQNRIAALRAGFGEESADPAGPVAPENEPWTAERLKTEMAQALAIKSPRQRNEALGELFSHISAPAIPALLTWLESLPSSVARNDLQRALVITLAQESPALAMPFAQRIGDYELQRTTLMRWATLDEPAASSWVESLPAGPLKKRCQQALIEEMASTDPDKAWALLSKGTPSPDEVIAVLSQWAEVDPKGAIKAALKLANGTQKSRHITTVVEIWLRNDPDGALAWIEHDAPDEVETQMTEAAARSLLYEDGARAMELAKGLTAPGRRLDMVREVARAWATLDMDSALNWVSHERDPRLRDAGLTAMFDSAYQDPSRYLPLLTSIGDPERRRQATERLGMMWAQEDPAAAMAWSRDLQDEELRERVQENIIGNWAGSDPRAVADLALETKGSAVEAVAWGLASQDLDEALQWVESIKDPESKDTALTAIVDSMAAIDPEQAADLLENLAPESRSRAAANVASSWAASDPEAAAQWALAHTSADDAFALSQTFAAWKEHGDPTRWVLDMRPGSKRDLALSALADSLEDPAQALQLLTKIADPSQRQESMRNYFSIWSMQNDNQAQAWLQSSGLSTAERNRLMEQVEEEAAPEANNSPCVCP